MLNRKYMRVIWREIPMYEGLYEVSSSGQIRSLITNKILVQSLNGSGYPHVKLCRNKKAKTTRIHCIVADVFLGPKPDRLVINHKNGVKTDNRVDNLEYCTHSKNSKHSYEIGLQKKYFGEDNIHSKLTVPDVKKIKTLLAIKMPQEQIADLFHVSQRTICSINIGKTWTQVEFRRA